MNNIYTDLVHRQLAESEIAALAALHTGELSAVGAYEEALLKIKDVSLLPVLLTCQQSHARRAQTLETCLRQLGAEPKEDPGIVGSLTRIIESGAVLFGDGPAINLLSSVESFAVEQYDSRKWSLGADSWQLVENELLPDQIVTEETMMLLCSLQKQKDVKQ
jgi:Domain of unknown function (DUF2383)